MAGLLGNEAVMGSNGGEMMMFVLGVRLAMGARTLAGWNAIYSFLKQRGEEWSTLTELAEEGTVGSDLLPKSAQSIVLMMVRVGVLERKHKKYKSGQGYRLREGVTIEVEEWRATPEGE